MQIMINFVKYLLISDQVQIFHTTVKIIKHVNDVNLKKSKTLDNTCFINLKLMQTPAC